MKLNLTTRERTLLWSFLGILFLLANALLWQSLLRSHARLSIGIAAQRQQIKTQETLLSEADLWAARAAWLRREPPPANPRQATVELLEAVKTLARANDITLEAPELGEPESHPDAESISLSLTARGDWKAMLEFLRTMQSPEKRIRFAALQLQADPAQPQKMLCKFQLAQWYAH